MSKVPQELFTMEVTKLRETEKAYLMRYVISNKEGGDNKPHTDWFPKSQIVSLIPDDIGTDRPEEAEDFIMCIPKWLVAKRLISRKVGDSDD